MKSRFFVVVFEQFWELNRKTGSTGSERNSAVDATTAGFVFALIVQRLFSLSLRSICYNGQPSAAKR